MADLRDYQQKRHFEKTPEPLPRAEAGAKRATFVIHRHEATQLHYDLRLAMDGVLKCWAIPRGFSYVPADKRLAVRTEDHPLEYEDFDGVIPKGEYGAGTMTVWDRGEYTTRDGSDPLKGLESGKLELRLFGHRLRGEWHMVKTRRNESGWLLFKSRDIYARSVEDRPYPFSIDLGGLARRGFPRRTSPMTPSRNVAPFSDPDWLFEVEFDGLRVFVTKRESSLNVREAGTGKELASLPGGLLESLQKLRARNVLLDGVLVSVDKNERPCRQTLKGRLSGANDAELTLYAFDLLYYEEWSLRELPLVDRKRLLATLLPASAALRFVDGVRGEGSTLAHVVSTAGLPAVIAKRADSAYQPGNSLQWRRMSVTPARRASKKNLPQLLKSSFRESKGYGRVRFTNRNKVFWPEEGWTKGDLIRFYERIAEYILPYLHNRPLHMRRFPDGLGGKSFYHHNAPGHTPDWVTTERIASEDGGETTRYIICNDRETLMYLANLASIDLHPWLSQLGSLDIPDWAILDLDPDEAPFADVVRVARALGKLLRGIGLRPYIKTSGASGLHVVLPLLPRYTYEHARTFLEGVARKVANDHPRLCTVERSMKRRRGRVYLDFMQNRRGQTVVPPYAARPVPGASVSIPLDWDELTADLNPAAWNIETVPARVAQLGDTFQAVFTDRQDLLPAIDAFQEMLRDEKRRSGR